MAYDLDLRLKVMDFIESGGGITKASKIFKVGRATIYRWLGREELAATKVENRQRKINIKELEEDVKNNPDMPLKEMAKKFGVTSALLCYQFKKMKITRKKQLLYQERETQNQAEYQKILRQLVLIYGIESLVFIDEAGFEEFVSSLYGWSKKGEKIYGEKQETKGKKENLVARRRKTKKDLIAPMLFTGSLNAVSFEGWLEFYLILVLANELLRYLRRGISIKKIPSNSAVCRQYAKDFTQRVFGEVLPPHAIFLVDKYIFQGT